MTTPMTKVCTKCGCEKVLDMFSTDAQGRLGKKARCKVCLAEYAKDWAERPGIKSRKKECFDRHIENNPESKLVYSARDRSKRKGIVCMLSPEDITIPEFCPVLGLRLEKGSRTAHDSAPSLDRLIPWLGYVPGNVCVISDRANRLKNDGTAEEHRRIADWITSGHLLPVSAVQTTKKPVRYMINGARLRSKKLNMSFDLTYEDIVVPERCPILDIPLSHGKGARNRHNGSPTLDRIDPAKGYVKGNVYVISYRANRVKNNGTAEEHRKIADWIDKMLEASEKAA